MYSALGKWSFKHWPAVVAVWVTVFVLVLGVSGLVGAAFESTPEPPDSESTEGFDILTEHFGGVDSGFPGSIVFRSELGVEAPEVVEAMEGIFSYVVSTYDEVKLASPYENPQGQFSVQGPDAGKIGFASLTIDSDTDQVAAGQMGADIKETADELVAAAGLTDDVQVEVGGAILAEFEPPQTELIGLAFAVIVLIVAFGSVLGMGLPIGVAVAGVGTGLGLINLLSNVQSVPEFTVQVGAMIGLGVGIDYALFIVTRYRALLKSGEDPLHAVGIAIDTAGRSVVFAGMTVVVSLLGMVLIGLDFVSGLGVGAAVTVGVTMVASITLLPALLGMVGHRVEVSRVRGVLAAGLVSIGLLAAGLGVLAVTLVAVALAGATLIVGVVWSPLRRLLPPRRERPIRDTVAYRWSRLIQARPIVALVVGVGILGLLAAPLAGLRLGFSDEGNFPEDTTTRKAYDLVAQGFGPGVNGPLIVVARIDDPSDGPQLEALQAQIAATKGVAFASPPIPNDPSVPEAARITVIPTTAPQEAETSQLVTTLRQEVATQFDGLDISVTGAVPANIDFSDFLAARILIFFGVVLAVSFVLLMAVFRSILVPVKAVIMNVLSIAASYGVVVAIFQWGWLGSITGVAGAPIEPFIPMMLFAIVFGLSMDYEVFLLSRVKEEYERTGDARQSVADGLALTARVISAAAAIMIVVFGSFLFEDNRIVKLFGTGLAMAVFLDATLVRMLLVPATMELLGERNWWFPAWLARIVPNLNVEGTHHQPTMEPAVEASKVG